MLSIEENRYWIWMSTLNLKRIVIKELINKYKNPEVIFNLPKSELIQSDILNTNEIQYIYENKNIKNLNCYINYMRKNKIGIINIYDKEYPVNLKNIYCSPLWLYYIGNIKLLTKKNIAIVGSRKCTSYGKIVAKNISTEISNQKINIVSGLAYGIDTYAHIGAIKEKARTIAVLGNGLDIIYPRENIKIANEIIKKDGLIISEYIMGTKPEKQNFPERNRIISGISETIIVVEAEEKSGSLITVDFALEQGKDVFAVPGNIYSKNSKGTNKIIKDGARIITSIDDILEEI